MFTWYQEVTQNERKTFWACFNGWALNALENQMFGLAIPLLLTYFAISEEQAGLLTSASLVTSALGGWFAGALSDWCGRVKTLQIMIAWFAIFTFMTAFATDYNWLLALKALQGFGIGGEWAAGAVLIAETISSQYRGKVMAIVQSAWAVGWGLAVILFSVIFSLLPENIAWRIVFAAGLLPSLLIFYIRRHVQEPVKQHPAAQKVEARQSIANALFGIFSPALIRTTLLGGILGLGAHGGYYAIMSWLPSYLTIERNLSILHSSVYLAVIIFAFWCGCMANSILLDKIDKRFNVALFAICCVITVRIYLLVPLTNAQILFLGFPLGFFAAGIPSSLGVLFNELYPQQYRGAGVGFCYNFGRIFSSVFPFLVAQMSTSMSLGASIGIYASWAYSVVVISVLMLPETRERDFKQINYNGQISDK